MDSKTKKYSVGKAFLFAIIAYVINWLGNRVITSTFMTITMRFGLVQKGVAVSAISMVFAIAVTTLAAVVAIWLYTGKVPDILSCIVSSTFVTVIIQLLVNALAITGAAKPINLLSNAIKFIFFLILMINVGKKEQSTLYRKKAAIQEGSPIDNFLKKFHIYIWVAGIIFIIGAFIVKPVSQAPAFFFLGLALVLWAASWSLKRKNKKDIEEYKKIVLPEGWPADCYYANYNQGLKEKNATLIRSANLNFYTACQKEQVLDLTTERNRQKAMLIAQNMKLKAMAMEEVAAAYEAGKADAEHNAQAANANTNGTSLYEKRIEELNLLAESMRYYGITGREKRIKMLQDMIAVAQEKVKEAEMRARQAQHTMLQKEHDWATHGGIASAIAGPAAGVATAWDIQMKNAQIREYNAQMAPYVAMVSSSYTKDANGYRQSIVHFQNDIERTKVALISEDDTQKVFSNLQISNIKTEVTSTGAVVVSAAFCADKEYRIFENELPAIDGCVKASIWENGQNVGAAYFVLPVQGITEQVELTSVCTRTTNPNGQYRIEMEPVQLWAIERL